MIVASRERLQPGSGAEALPAVRRRARATDRMGEHMKRVAGAFVLLAAVGGCMTANQRDQRAGNFGRVGVAKEVPGVVGPWGTPVAAAANGMSAQGRSVIPVHVQESEPGILPAVFASGPGSAGGVQLAQYGPEMRVPGSGPVVDRGFQRKKTGQVPPPPFAGPPGAVAAVGALPYGMPAMANARSSVRFAGPDNMLVSWLAPGPDGKPAFRNALKCPARYNFLQGGVYRLKLANIPKRPELELYPTIEVVAQNPKTTTFLAHSAVPVTFTDEDFEQVIAGNMVVKVVYLPDPQFQDLAVAGPDEVVSTRLDPGVDPVQEAMRRGSVLLIIRMGNIDLEAPGTPAMETPNPYLQPPPGMVPGAPLPPKGTLPVPTPKK